MRTLAEPRYVVRERLTPWKSHGGGHGGADEKRRQPERRCSCGRVGAGQERVRAARARRAVVLPRRLLLAVARRPRRRRGRRRVAAPTATTGRNGRRRRGVVVELRQGGAAVVRRGRARQRRRRGEQQEEDEEERVRWGRRRHEIELGPGRCWVLLRASSRWARRGWC